MRPGGSVVGLDLEKKFQRLERDFHVLANSIPQLAWIADADGSISWYNDRWFDYTGSTLPEMEGSGWRSVHHPDHVNRVVEKLSKCFETGEEWGDLFPLRSKFGEYRWFLSRAKPIRDEAGAVIRWFGTNTDVTDQIEVEQRQRRLLREIDHRAKNALAIAQAIVNLTDASSTDGYKAAVIGRVGALARAHRLLAEARWDGVDLSTLLREELTALLGGDDDRIALRGPATQLSPALAQTGALIFHEFAANAARFGALSTPNGSLSIAWRNDEARLLIDWRERGGRNVRKPEREGFGSALINAVIGEFERYAIRPEWREDGFSCEIEIELAGAAEAAGTGDAAPVKAADPAKAGADILIVEDEALTALDLEMRLKTKGYSVIGPAASVAKAKVAMKSNSLDLAILDANLDGERSYPLAEDLAAAGVPIIFYTGYEKLEDLPESLSAYSVLTKPCSDLQLFNAIRDALGR